MARQVFTFNPPERFVAGTIGQPGARTFYLQAVGGGRSVSVALEKTQVAALAERVGELLDEVRHRGAPGVPTAEEAAQGAVEDLAPLEVPLEEEFRVGTIALAWDGDSATVVIAAQAVPDDPEQADAAPLGDDDEGPPVLRVHLTAVGARAFARRAERLVASGRPPCPLCGLPLDPAGHICPRQNGHRIARS